MLVDNDYVFFFSCRPTLNRNHTHASPLRCARLEFRTLSNAQFTNSLCFREIESEESRVLSAISYGYYNHNDNKCARSMRSANRAQSFSLSRNFVMRAIIIGRSLSPSRPLSQYIRRCICVSRLLILALCLLASR